MNIELVCCEQVLLQEIGSKHFTRDKVALTYAMAILSSWPTDFEPVNKAIVERWSFSALDYIINKAWKLIEEKQAQQQE